MNTIIEVILWVACAWLAYTVTASERRTRMWSPSATIGIFLAIFGAIGFGVLSVWNWFAPKLTDTIPSEGDLLVGGIVILAALVVCALDLLGKVDVMGKIRDAVNRPDMSKPAAPPSGD